jgi:putative hydrolase of the HAD superfamily
MLGNMGLRYAIFDLDDTLYCCENGLMQEVGRRIQLWLTRNIDVTADEAAVLRRRYFLQYGTTLGGLIEERAVDSGDYLAFVHDIPVERYVKPAPELASMLDSLSLEKVVYTNATRDYGERILRRLGVAHCFQHVIGIEEVGLRNKPYPDAYEALLELLDASGPECVMVEDSARNLRPAKALGMTTVLVRPPAAPERFSDLADADGGHDDVVDHFVGSVLEVGPLLARLAEKATA